MAHNKIGSEFILPYVSSLYTSTSQASDIWPYGIPVLSPESMCARGHIHRQRYKSPAAHQPLWRSDPTGHQPLGRSDPTGQLLLPLFGSHSAAATVTPHQGISPACEVEGAAGKAPCTLCHSSSSSTGGSSGFADGCEPPSRREGPQDVGDPARGV